MKLPKQLSFKSLYFSDGMNGQHEQVFRNEEYGIIVYNFKQSVNHKWEKTFTADRFKDVVFKTGKALAEAFAREE